MSNENAAADNEANKEEDAKDDSGDKDEELGPDGGKGICYLIGVQVYGFYKTLKWAIKTFIMSFCWALSVCWYPCKERSRDCCDCCGKRMNPHLDPAYSGFEWGE